MTDGRQTRIVLCSKAGRSQVGQSAKATWRSMACRLPAAGIAAAVLGAFGVAALLSSAQIGHQDRAITGAWQRAVDADQSIVHVFERGDAGSANLHPTSSVEAVKPLVVGDRVTLVTPDGAIHTLRVCDPASAGAAIAADCLNAFAARAVLPAATPVPQRSL